MSARGIPITALGFIGDAINTLAAAQVRAIREGHAPGMVQPDLIV